MSFCHTKFGIDTIREFGTFSAYKEIVLDDYLKQHFWTFVVGTLFCAAWLSASISNVFAARALQPPVETMFAAPDRPRRIVQREPALPNDAQAFLSRNLFGAEREDLTPPPPPTPAEPEPEPGIDAGECVPDRCRKSGLAANLLATFWAGESALSRAVFQPTSGDSVQVLSVGEELLDQATVTAVLRNTVCVSRAGSCEIFSLEEPKKKVSVSRPKVASIEPRSNDSDSTIQKVGERSYEISRNEVDGVLSNLNKIARQARIVPSFKNGKANGFKLFSIRPKSLYSKLGIKNGDIIQKINGYEMSGPEKALEIYTKLKDASNITVDLMRRGRPQTMSVNIK